MEEFVQCPICGIKRRKLHKHIQFTHNLTSKEFKEKYPDSKLESDNEKSKRSKAASDSYSEDRRALQSEIGKRVFTDFNKTQWNGSEGERRKNRRSIIMKNQLHKYWSDDENRKKAPERARKLWKNEEYREKVLDRSCMMGKLIEFDNGLFRSSWESKLAKSLSDNGINWEYESLRIQYKASGRERIYIPDFYIRDINLVLEVKGFYREKDNIFIKKDYCISNGYGFRFVTSEDLNENFESLVRFITEKSNDYRKDSN